MTGVHSRHYVSQWRAAASPGGLVGLLLIILSALVLSGSVLGLTGRADIPLPDVALWLVFVVSIVVGLLLAFLIWGYLSIRYELDPKHLRIRWGLRTHTIFLDDISFIGPLTGDSRPRQRGWRPFWPGYYISRAKTPVGIIRTVATLPPRRQVLIVSDRGERFAISPERPILFLEEFGRLLEVIDRDRTEIVDGDHPETPAQRLLDAGWTGEFIPVSASPSTAPIIGPSQPQVGSLEVPSPPVSVVRSKPSSTSPLLRPIILSDPVALLFLALGVLTTALMAVFILVRFQDVPPSITLHWTVEGLPGRVGTAQEIWILPTICGLVLIANFGLAWSIALFDRFAARLLLGSTLLVQVVAWVALLTLLG
jgi:hypothetical protein